MRLVQRSSKKKSKIICTVIRLKELFYVCNNYMVYFGVDKILDV